MISVEGNVFVGRILRELSTLKHFSKINVEDCFEYCKCKYPELKFPESKDEIVNKVLEVYRVMLDEYEGKQ